MSKILFENKKVALGFAGAIIVGAMIFSGVSTTSASSDAPQSTLAQGEVEAPEKSNNNAEVTENGEKEEIAFADDEELVDDTGGFEPTADEEKADDGDTGDSRESDEADRSDREDRDEPRERRGRMRDFDEDGFLRLEDDGY